MGTALYTVRTDYGGMFVKHAYKNEDLTAIELETLITNLQSLHDRMVKEDVEQDTIKSYLYESVMQPILEHCKVFYPCTLPFINGRPDLKPNRPYKAKRYCGIYFATHPNMSDLIKIGYSIDVYQRMKSLFHQYEKEPLTVIGFIETSEPNEVETYIHRTLASGRSDGEWFDFHVVQEWLERLAT